MTALVWRRTGFASWTEFPAWLVTTILENGLVNFGGRLSRAEASTAAKYRNRCGWGRTMEDVPGR